MGEQVELNSIRSHKERVWLAEYLQCFDATAAARAAGYKWPGKIGWRKKQKFAAVIAAELERRAMAADEALDRLAERARFDVSPYIVQGEDGSIGVDLDRLVADGHGRHIKGVVHTRYGDRIVFHDSQDALFLIVKTLGLETAAEADRAIDIRVSYVDPD